MGDLHETDILIWSEHQADLLRRVANGERANGVDWPHVVEEIADVGISELNAIRGLLAQAIIHLIRAFPDRVDARTGSPQPSSPGLSGGSGSAPSCRERSPGQAGG